MVSRIKNAKTILLQHNIVIWAITKYGNIPVIYSLVKAEFWLFEVQLRRLGLYMHQQPMVPDHGTQYKENPSSKHGGMHKDGLTDRHFPIFPIPLRWSGEYKG